MVEAPWNQRKNRGDSLGGGTYLQRVVRRRYYQGWTDFLSGPAEFPQKFVHCLAAAAESISAGFGSSGYVERRKQKIGYRNKRLTHNLTQNRKFLCGMNGMGSMRGG